MSELTYKCYCIVCQKYYFKPVNVHLVKKMPRELKGRDGMLIIPHDECGEALKKEFAKHRQQKYWKGGITND